MDSQEDHKADSSPEEPLDYKQEDPLANLSEQPQPGSPFYIRPARALSSYPLFIDNPLKVEKTLGSFVRYTMGGSDVNENLTRRYSDFFALYEKLIQRWPGVYIPNIPPKKVTGNFSASTIKSRMRLLNRFLLNLSEIEYLYNSEEAKLFRNNISDIATALEKLPALSYLEILERMKVAFPWNNEEYDLTLGKSNITMFEEFLKKTLKHISEFRSNASSAAEKKEAEKKNYLSLLQQFTQHERLNMMSYADSNDTVLIFQNPNYTSLSDKIMHLNQQLTNSYAFLKNWLEEEELDIEAMLLAIKQISEMLTTQEKLRHKISSLDSEIKSMEAGNVGLFKSLFKKKDDLVSKAKNDKKDTEEKLQSLEQIISLTCANMENKIDSFKLEKMQNYYRNVKIFAILQRENNKILRELWKEVKQALSEVSPNVEEGGSISNQKPISSISKDEFFGNQNGENYANEENIGNENNVENIENS